MNENVFTNSNYQKLKTLKNKIMETTLITLSIIAILWVLRDRISKFLSGGKSFAPNETTWK